MRRAGEWWGKLLAMFALVTTVCLPAIAWSWQVPEGGAGRPGAVTYSGTIEYAFSPRGGAERLVLKVIESARFEIRVMAYSFTSAPVVRALLDAKRRGVDVALVVDHQDNVVKNSGGKSRAALAALVNAGCRVRTTSAFKIMHDKVLVVDRETVGTGSMNFTAAGAIANSENVIVVWKNQGLAAAYLNHWESRFSSGQDLLLRY